MCSQTVKVGSMPAFSQFGLAVASVRAFLRALPLCLGCAPLGSRPVFPQSVCHDGPCALEGRMPTDGVPVSSYLAISLAFANVPGGRIFPRRVGFADANVFGRYVETVTGQPGRVVVSDFEELTHLSRFDQVHRVLAEGLQ